MTMLRLPEQLGKTKLAYITDSEKKLLRRRDAVKGRKAKSTAEGVPYLGPDDADTRPMPSTKHSKKHGYKKQYTDMASKKKDYNKYVDSYGDLSNAYNQIKNNPNSTQAKYWKPRMANMSKQAFGEAHAGESMALQSKTYRGATKAMGSKARSIPNRVAKIPVKTPVKTPVKSPVTQPSSGGGGGGGGEGGGTSTLNIDVVQQQSPVLDEIVIHGPESEVVQERIKDLINTNSPLFKAATTKALQSMNASGLANSSMAQEAVMSAIMAVAIPIASADAQTFTEQRMANQNASNAFKAQQNAAYYQAFVTRLNGQIQQTLQQLTNKAANWRAVLAERGRIAVTSGMSDDAARNALKLVTPTWF
jgi:hypothetical protein